MIEWELDADILILGIKINIYNKMVSQSLANYSVNVGVHVFILFTFLSIFFFAYASDLERESVNKSLKSIIDDQTESLLTEIDKWDKRIYPDKTNINWNTVNENAKKLVAESQGELPEIKENNDKLFKFGVTAIIILFVTIVAYTLYFMFVKKYDIHIGAILLENFVIFAFVGAIEYYFFSKVVVKFVPVTPEFASMTILERIKKNINKQLI